MIVGEGLDGLRRQLESDLVLRHHVDMHDVSLDVNQLVVEESLY